MVSPETAKQLAAEIGIFRHGSRETQIAAMKAFLEGKATVYGMNVELDDSLGRWTIYASSSTDKVYGT